MSAQPGLVQFANRSTQRGFTQVWNTLLYETKLSMGARFTFTVLCSVAWMNDPSVTQEQIADWIGVSERQARRYIAELEQAQLVTVVQRGLQLPNAYTLHDPTDDALHAISTGTDRTLVSGQERTPVSAPMKKEYKEGIQSPTPMPDKRISDPQPGIERPQVTYGTKKSSDSAHAIRERSGAIPKLYTVKGMRTIWRKHLELEPGRRLPAWADAKARAYEFPDGSVQEREPSSEPSRAAPISRPARPGKKPKENIRDRYACLFDDTKDGAS